MVICTARSKKLDVCDSELQRLFRALYKWWQLLAPPTLLGRKIMSVEFCAPDANEMAIQLAMLPEDLRHVLTWLMFDGAPLPKDCVYDSQEYHVY